MANNCEYSEPWPCLHPVAGGNNPLGTILCIRHLAAIIAPPQPPPLDRIALKKTWRAEGPPTTSSSHAEPVSEFTHEELLAIATLAPLEPTFVRHQRNYGSSDGSY